VKTFLVWIENAGAENAGGFFCGDGDLDRRRIAQRRRAEVAHVLVVMEGAIGTRRGGVRMGAKKEAPRL
jgi:hypothetical protein